MRNQDIHRTGEKIFWSMLFKILNFRALERLKTPYHLPSLFEGKNSSASFPWCLSLTLSFLAILLAES